MKPNAIVLFSSAAAVLGFIGGVFVAALFGLHERQHVFSVAIIVSLLIALIAGYGASATKGKALLIHGRIVWAAGFLSLVVGLWLFWRMIY